MQSSTKRDFFTHLFLFVLLFVRFPIADFALSLVQLSKSLVFFTNLESLRLLQNQSLQFFYGYSFILIAIVIVVNRNNLNRLNIDKSFMLVFLCGGLDINQSPNSQLKLLTVIVSVFVSVLCFNGVLKFGDKKPSLLRIMLTILIVFFLNILFISKSVTFTKIHWAVQWFLLYLPLVVVEEVMFRGMFWMLLKKLGFSEFKVIVFQAILFWLSHINFLKDFAFFWVIIPIASILLGVIVWRSKSLTPSVIAHVLFNVLLGLYQTL